MSDTEGEEEIESGLSQHIPVFCTADIPEALLNKYFNEANGSEYLEDDQLVGVYIGTRNVDSIDTPTSAPVQNYARSPFVGKSIDDIRRFAAQKFDAELISTENIVILDAQTLRDSSTCLLIMLKVDPDSEEVTRDDDYRTVRSDFASSLVVLNGIEYGTTGEEQVDDDLGEDGVIRLPPLDG